MKKIILISFLVGILLGETKINPQTGLIIAPNSDLVEMNCIACHGAGLIVNMHASREEWLKTIRWMQETQGLWEFAKEDEDKILDYLATYYGEQYNTSRRLPLPVLQQYLNR